MLIKELDAELHGIDQMKVIIDMQQAHAKVIGVAEVLSLEGLIAETLEFNKASLEKLNIRVERHGEPLPPVSVEKHRLLQILMNLLNNARHALEQSEVKDRRLDVR